MSDPTPAGRLEAYLHRQIPLSAAMGVRVDDPGPDRVVLAAPLDPNTNHRSTAFGGSVSALATLAGWAVVHGSLRREGYDVQVVIQRGTTEYLHPVTEEFRAICDGVDASEWRRLLRALVRSGRGRAHLTARIESGGRLVARFEGSYVAIERPAG